MARNRRLEFVEATFVYLRESLDRVLEFDPILAERLDDMLLVPDIGPDGLEVVPDLS